MVCWQESEAALPQASVAVVVQVRVMVMMPAQDASTASSEVKVTVGARSTASVAVTSGSPNRPKGPCRSQSPVNSMVVSGGQTMDTAGGVASGTVMFCVQKAVLPQASVAVQNRAMPSASPEAGVRVKSV